ncbi:hypothetical protein D3C76_1629460 [compost metagenome]
MPERTATDECNAQRLPAHQGQHKVGHARGAQHQADVEGEVTRLGAGIAPADTLFDTAEHHHHADQRREEGQAELDPTGADQRG